MTASLPLIDQAVSVALRILQAEKDLTNVCISAETGIEGRTLIRILHGQRAVTVGELKLLATALGTLPSAIVEAADARSTLTGG